MPVLLTLIIAVLMAAVVALYLRLEQANRRYMESNQSIYNALMEDARKAAQRTPNDLSKILAAMSDSQDKTLRAVVESIRATFPTSPAAQFTGGIDRPYGMPVPFYADERTQDNSDPTDDVLPSTYHREDSMVSSGANPFGIDGLVAIDHGGA